MGCCVVVRSFDERPRRVSQEVASGMDLMRETLGKMDVASLKIQAPDLMRSLIKMGAKLCPVPLLALKSLAFALVDAGVIGIGVLPQEKADLQMEECRKALRLVASEMATMMGTPTVVRQELISGN